MDASPGTPNPATEAEAFLKTPGDVLLSRMLIHGSCHMLSPSVGGLALELLDGLRKKPRLEIRRGTLSNPAVIPTLGTRCVLV